MAEQQTSTPTDDVSSDSGNEQAQLNDILRNSKFAQEAGIVPESLPEAEEDPAVVEEEPEQEDLTSDTEAAENEDEVVEEDTEEKPEEVTEGEDEGSDKESSTDAETYAISDLEDVMVTHKIDGEEVTLPLSEWIASSATKQHLSKQGRELGEARKALEEEKSTKLGELEQLSTALASSLYQTEMKAQEQYGELSKKIAAAEAADDTYEIGELSKQRTKVQKEYWEAKNNREGVLTEVKKIQDANQQEIFQEQVKKFNQDIVNVIPDWDTKTADDLRTFALAEGLPEELLNIITDTSIVKFVHDYKTLKEGLNQGAQKRQKVRKLKTPVKRSKPEEKKKLDHEAMVKARAFKEDSSKEDQDAFLKQIARKSLGG